MSISTFPPFNISMFIEEDGTTINEDKRILNKKKCQNLLNFVTFKELSEKHHFQKLQFRHLRLENFLTFP